jgi:hypothetical protein
VTLCAQAEQPEVAVASQEDKSSRRSEQAVCAVRRSRWPKFPIKRIFERVSEHTTLTLLVGLLWLAAHDMTVSRNSESVPTPNVDVNVPSIVHRLPTRGPHLCRAHACSRSVRNDARLPTTPPPLLPSRVPPPPGVASCSERDYPLFTHVCNRVLWRTRSPPFRMPVQQPWLPMPSVRAHVTLSTPTHSLWSLPNLPGPVRRGMFNASS